MARRHDGRRAERGPRIGQDRGLVQRIERHRTATVTPAGPKHAAKRNGTPAGAAAMDRVTCRVPRLDVLAECHWRRRQCRSPASEQFASFQTDAPACDNCGAITVRNGNCYLCHNCGSSMGCS